MRKIIYTLFLFASFVASSFNPSRLEAQVNVRDFGIEPSKKSTTSEKPLVFSDVLNQNDDGSLIAAHYSHRSHSSHSSHRSHYSSRY